MSVLRAVGKRGEALLEQMREAVEASEIHAVRWDAGRFMPLVMERIGGMRGNALYALSHTGEQNGDLMRDPEVVFWRHEGLGWYPISFRNDYLGQVHEYVHEDPDNPHGLVVNFAGQNDLTGFCKQWMKNLREQGFDFSKGEEVAA